MQSLGIILFKSVGAGYSALNMAGRSFGLEILEFAPLGESSQLLVLGEKKITNKFIKELRIESIERSLCLENFDEKILRSYLSLENTKLQEFTLIVEARFSGDLFAAAVELKKRGLSTIDFRVFRSVQSTGYLTMTGNDLDEAKTWIAEQRSQLSRQFRNITLISNLSEGFRHFVDFES